MQKVYLYLFLVECFVNCCVLILPRWTALNLNIFFGSIPADNCDFHDMLWAQSTTIRWSVYYVFQQLIHFLIWSFIRQLFKVLVFECINSLFDAYQERNNQKMFLYLIMTL